MLWTLDLTVVRMERGAGQSIGNAVPAMIAFSRQGHHLAWPRANFARRASQITDFRWANLGASTVRRKSLHLQRRTRPDFKNPILKQREHRTPDNLPTVGVSCLWSLLATNHTRGHSVHATQRETMYRLGALIRAIAVTAFTGRRACP